MTLSTRSVNLENESAPLEMAKIMDEICSERSLIYGSERSLSFLLYFVDSELSLIFLIVGSELSLNFSCYGSERSLSFFGSELSLIFLIL